MCSDSTPAPVQSFIIPLLFHMSVIHSKTEYNYNSLIVALGAGAAFFALFVGIVVILLQKRQKSLTGDRHTTLLIKRTPEKPLTLKKPTAVRSPGQVVGAGVLLKKSPSPTGSKSPPGASAAGTPIDPRRKSLESFAERSNRSSVDSSAKNSPDVEAAIEAVEQSKVNPPEPEVVSDSCLFLRPVAHERVINIMASFVRQIVLHQIACLPLIRSLSRMQTMDESTIMMRGFRCRSQQRLLGPRVVWAKK